MPRFIIKLILVLCPCINYAQQDLPEYLNTHHYSFTLDDGFAQNASETLKQKLAAYKLILQAEGGSHELTIYQQLPLVWIKFLNKYFGLKHVFLEFGHSAAVCINNFLLTNDSLDLYNHSSAENWRRYYRLNASLPVDQKINFFGVDFNRPASYYKALKKIMPGKLPPGSIRQNIDFIKEINDSSKDCSDVIRHNSDLRGSLALYKGDYKEYLGRHYRDFERIVLTKGTCKDGLKNRNYNIAANFLSFDEESNDALYYGELGMAHTILKNKVAAAIINAAPKFKNRVCVINLYCYNCSTPGEQVSNWPLKNIESDILQFFLPYCSGDFTLFDLTGNPAFIKKYADYGQFLVIAKNQH